MAAKMGKLLLLMSGLALMLLSMNAKADDAPTDLTAQMGVEKIDDAMVETQAPKVEFPQPSDEEKTIFSTILKSFKNGHVDLATLASALNDPNISRLASSLSNANLTKLSAALDGGPQGRPDLGKLVAALNDPDLNLDKVVAAFGDSSVLTSKQDTMGAKIMDTMKEWAKTINEKVQSSPPAAPQPPSTPDKTNEQEETDKRNAKLEGLMHEADKLMEQDGSGIPAGFERSTPSPDADTYGKSLMSGEEETVPAMTTATTEEEGDVEGSAQSSMPLDHKVLYLLLAGVFGLSMVIFLATRFAKSYRGDGDGEETARSATRITV